MKTSEEIEEFWRKVDKIALNCIAELKELKAARQAAVPEWWAGQYWQNPVFKDPAGYGFYDETWIADERRYPSYEAALVAMGCYTAHFSAEPDYKAQIQELLAALKYHQNQTRIIWLTQDIIAKYEK